MSCGNSDFFQGASSYHCCNCIHCLRHRCRTSWSPGWNHHHHQHPTHNHHHHRLSGWLVWTSYGSCKPGMRSWTWRLSRWTATHLFTSFSYSSSSNIITSTIIIILLRVPIVGFCSIFFLLMWRLIFSTTSSGATWWTIIPPLANVFHSTYSIIEYLILYCYHNQFSFSH